MKKINNSIITMFKILFILIVIISCYHEYHGLDRYVYNVVSQNQMSSKIIYPLWVVTAIISLLVVRLILRWLLHLTEFETNTSKFFTKEMNNFTCAKRNRFTKNLTKVVLIFVCVFLLVALTNLLLHGIEFENTNILNKIKDHNPTYYRISTVLIAPIFEELIYRKLGFSLFSLFDEKGTVRGEVISLLVTSLFFGFSHGLSSFTKNGIYDSGAWMGSFAYTLMGIAFGLVYLASNKKICSSISVHMANNLGALYGMNVDFVIFLFFLYAVIPSLGEKVFPSTNQSCCFFAKKRSK